MDGICYTVSVCCSSGYSYFHHKIEMRRKGSSSKPDSRCEIYYKCYLRTVTFIYARRLCPRIFLFGPPPCCERTIRFVLRLFGYDVSADISAVVDVIVNSDT